MIEQQNKGLLFSPATAASSTPSASPTADASAAERTAHLAATYLQREEDLLGISLTEHAVEAIFFAGPLHDPNGWTSLDVQERIALENVISNYQILAQRVANYIQRVLHLPPEEIEGINTSVQALIAQKIEEAKPVLAEDIAAHRTARRRVRAFSEKVPGIFENRVGKIALKRKQKLSETLSQTEEDCKSSPTVSREELLAFRAFAEPQKE